MLKYKFEFKKKNMFSYIPLSTIFFLTPLSLLSFNITYFNQFEVITKDTEDADRSVNS